MFTPYFKDAHNIAKIVKEHNKNTLVVFGGAHASTFTDKVMADSNVDVVVVGEGEVTIREVLKRYKEKRYFEGVKGIVHRVNGIIKKETSQEPIQNLDEISFPAWDLLERDMEVVRQEQIKNKFLMRKPVGAILTSRGCPKECYFCSVKLMWGRKWRMRSARNVVDEIEFLKKKYGYREFHFVDDNSSVSKARMHEICDELLKRKLNVKVATPTGIAIETLDKEILSKMKKAGFYRLCFGIESGSPDSQKIIKKRVDLDRAKKVIAQANALGFWTAATFIVGFPHDTKKEIEATIAFIKTANLDFIICYLLVPQIGTEVYNILKQQGLIDLDKYVDVYSADWHKISLMYNHGFKTLAFSNEDLQNMLSQIYKAYLFYKIFSLRTYINLLRKIKSFEDFVYMAKLLSLPAKMVTKMVFGDKLSNTTMQGRVKKLKSIDT
ncbi:MAG: radical SAM protein [Candidatus Omnitrophica bacterium]|nr:radical SAM protein [Candidatus Omnitrophota bacterium]